MADIQRVVEILFNATDNTSAALNNISSSVSNLEQAFAPFSQAQSTLIDLEKKVLGVSVALAGLAVFEAGNFNASIAEIGTLFNATGEEVDRLKSQVLDFASTSSSSIGDSTEALYNYISATGDTANGVEALSKIERLAIAGKADLNTATSAVTTVLNAYGLKIEDLSDVQDVFFTTVQNGTTTLPELGANIGQIAAVASAAGVDFDVIGASMAALTGAIGNTNISTTQLKALLTELSRPSDALKTALGSLATESGRLPEKLNAILSATGGTQVEMNKLFGSTEAASAALILANDSAGTFNNTLLAMENRAGATQRAYEEMEKQFGAVNTRLLNSVRTTLITAGDNLIDGYSDVALALSSIFAELRPQIDQGAFDPIFDFLNSKSTDLTALLASIASNLPEALAQVDFSRFVTSLESLFAGIENLFGELFGDADLTTVEGLKDAIQGVVNAFALLNETVAGIAEQWRPVFSAIGDLIQDNGKLEESAGGVIGEYIALGSQISTAAGILGNASGIIGGVGGVLSSMADTVILLNGAQGLAGLIPVLQRLGPAFTAALGPVGLFTAGVYAVYQAATALGADDLGVAIASRLYDFFNEGSTELSSKVQEYNRLRGEQVAAIGAQAAEVNQIITDSFQAQVEADELIARRQEIANEYIKDLEGVQLTVKQTYEEGERSVVGFTYAQEELISAQQYGIKVTKDAKTGVTEFSDGLVGISTKFKNSAKAAEEAFKKTDEYQLKLLQIASDERIKQIEVSYDLKIAQVEADATKVSAAFDAIGVSIESSGKLLSDYFNILADPNLGLSQQFALEKLIAAEEQRRQEAFEAEQALIEAQIENIRLRNEQLEDGGALIEVDGAGLQPHLEAFMFEILEAIQVRVNQEGYDTLIGA